MTIEDDIAFFERVPTLHLLGRDALRILAIGAENRYVHSGEALFSAGETADGAFVVQEGSFSLSANPALGDGITVGPLTLLGELGFENAYALVMPRKRAEQLGIRTIADLASRTASMSIAGDYEFFSRPEWAALRRAYGLSFRAQRQMQPDFMYAAAASGEVDVIAGYTSDGLIAKYDLVVLGDPRQAIPPYDAILLLAPRRANDAALAKALAPLLGRIDIATMRQANLRAAGNDATSSPDAVARWLWEKIGTK